MGKEVNTDNKKGVNPSPTGKTPAQVKAPPTGAPSLKPNIKPDTKAACI